ncbi:hypothetical protein [Persicobacter psychrovividus]|uniref:Outer membrane protein beta-barrel domain-containing protein n=1 Tax=Persicobacter psychrovividus TaxID=387638 RepID=A0ABN6LBD0_9BACT|nr:hypothetical protein PEPS_25560 [Persicobacter psychrovividus]
MDNQYRKIVFCLICCVYFSVQALASGTSPVTDTLKVETNKGAKILIIANDKEALKELKVLDVNQILQDMDVAADSVKKEKLVIKKTDDTYLRAENTLEPFDAPLEDHSDEAFRKRGKKYQKQPVKEKKRLIIHYGKDSEMNKDLEAQGAMRFDNDEGMGIYWGEKYKMEINKKYRDKPAKRRSYGYGLIDFGGNNWLEDGKTVSGNQPYNVRPWGSWYVGLGGGYMLMLGNHFGFDFSTSISWYNFKFQDATVRLVKGPDELEFVHETAPNISSIKSKLTVPYINASFIPTFKIGPRYRGLSIGAGVYGGYRIGAHTKVKQKVDGSTNKPKSHKDFYLENLRYGLRAQLGWEDSQFFVAYDLNPIFQKDHAPELNAFTIGVTFQIR